MPIFDMESSLTPSHIGASDNDQHSGKRLPVADLSAYDHAQDSRMLQSATKGEFNLQVSSIT